MNLQRVFLTFFGAGLSPIAPGTVGTLASMPLGFLVIYYLGVNSLSSLALVVAIIAVFEINRYEKEGGEHDKQEIVIDEAVGVWLTMSITFAGVGTIFNHSYAIYIAAILSFASFRLFDIWKPSTIGYIDKKLKGGIAVVGDDFLAGIAAGIFNLVIFKAIDFGYKYLVTHNLI